MNLSRAKTGGFGWLIYGTTSALRAQTNSGGYDPSLKLAPPYPEIQPTIWETYHWAIMIGGIFFLSALGLLLLAILKSKPAATENPEDLARVALAKLSDRPEDGACLSQISQTLRHYFSVAFQLPAGEMTTAELGAILTAHDGVGTDLGKRASHFLLECDQRKFAPLPVP